jgi:hypothetical protein
LGATPPNIPVGTVIATSQSDTHTPTIIVPVRCFGVCVQRGEYVNFAKTVDGESFRPCGVR